MNMNDTFETNEQALPSTGFSQSFHCAFASLKSFSDNGVQPRLFNQAPASKPFSLPELGDVLTAATVKIKETLANSELEQRFAYYSTLNLTPNHHET